MNRAALLACFALSACLEPVEGPESSQTEAVDARGVSFAHNVRPILSRCMGCHDGRASSHIGLDLGGLDLSTLGSLRRGGFTSGTGIVVPFEPDDSALVKKLRGTYAYGSRMPKDGPPFLSDAEI